MSQTNPTEPNDSNHELLPCKTMCRRCSGPILRSALAPAAHRLFRSLAKRRFPIDNPESRVEFRIRKMHSLHLHMRALNYGGVPVA